jgi:ABC-type transporter Mla subunit MlaD
MQNEMELKELVIELSDNLNQCMAQQAALQHAVYALLANVSDKKAVRNSLNICAESFLEAQESLGLPDDMIETYQDEIAELLDTLSDDIEQQRDADWANEGGNIHLDEDKQ